MVGKLVAATVTIGLATAGGAALAARTPPKLSTEQWFASGNVAIGVALTGGLATRVGRELVHSGLEFGPEAVIGRGHTVMGAGLATMAGSVAYMLNGPEPKE